MRTQAEIQSDPKWIVLFDKLTFDERSFLVEVFESVAAEERERCAKKAAEVGRVCADGWYKNPGQAEDRAGIAASNTSIFIEEAISGTSSS